MYFILFMCVLASGVIEYEEFLQIMTNTLQKFQEQKEEDKEEQTHQLPFDLMATQFRRMKYMDGILSGDKDSIKELVKLAENQSRVSMLAQMEKESGASTVVHEPSAPEPQSHAPANPYAPRYGSGGNSSSSPGLSSRHRPQSHEVLQRLARTHVDAGLMSSLGPEQLAVINRVLSKQEGSPEEARRQVQQHERLLGTGRASPRVSASSERRAPMGEILYGGSLPSSPRYGESFPTRRDGGAMASSSSAASPRGSAFSPRQSMMSPRGSMISPRGSSSLVRDGLLEMPQSDLQLFFSRPTVKVPSVSNSPRGVSSQSPRGGSSQSPRGGPPLSPRGGPSKSLLGGRQVQGGGVGRGGEDSQLHAPSFRSTRMDAMGTSGISPRLSEERHQMEGIQRAMNASALVQELTPRSARQKSLDYAAGMCKSTLGHPGEGGSNGDPHRPLGSDRAAAASSAHHASNGIIRRGPPAGVGSSAWQRHQMQPAGAAAPAVSFVGGSMAGGSSAVSPRRAGAGKSPAASPRSQQTAGSSSSITSRSMQVPPLQMSRIHASG